MWSLFLTIWRTPSKNINNDILYYSENITSAIYSRGNIIIRVKELHYGLGLWMCFVKQWESVH